MFTRARIVFGSVLAAVGVAETLARLDDGQVFGTSILAGLGIGLVLSANR